MKQFRQIFSLLLLLTAGGAVAFTQTAGIKIQKEYSYGTKKKDDFLHDAIECVDGCLLAIGETEGTSGDEERDALLMKLDRQGKVAFMERMGTPKDDIGMAVAELPSGQILASGITRHCADGKGKEDACPLTAWLRCRGNNGDRLWQKELAKHKSSLNIGDILVDRMRNQVLVSGTLNGFLWVCITDFSGEKIIEKTFDQGLPELKNLQVRQVRSLQFNGAYYLYGGGDNHDDELLQTPFVMKLNEFAEVLEIVSFPDYHLNETTQISLLADGWLGLTGTAQGDVSTDYFFLRVDTTLDKSTSRFAQIKSRGEDESGAEIVQVGEKCYLFGDLTRKTTAAKSDFFIARFTPEGKPMDERKELFGFGNKYEEKALRLISKTDNTHWLCGSLNNGGEFAKDFNFWFARLEVPSPVVSKITQATPLQPPFVRLETSLSNETLTLFPGGSDYVRIALQNPNSEPLRGLTLTTTAENPPDGLVFSSEINAPEIAAGATQTFDLAFQADEENTGGNCKMTTVLKAVDGQEIGRWQYDIEMKAPEKPALTLISYDWVTQSPGSVSTKGLPLTLRASLKNTGTGAADGFTIYWQAPQSVPLFGNDQQKMPTLPPGEAITVEVTVLPPAGFSGNQLELKAFVNSSSTVKGFEFVFPVELASGDFAQTAVTVAPKKEAPTSEKPNDGISLVVVWSSRNDMEQTTIQQVYEINAIGISNKPLKVENFKVILNGDTISFAGVKMDEVSLKNTRSDNSYKYYFTYSDSLKPGRNSLRVMAIDEQATSSTDELIVNYKAYDKGTLYVYSIGIPDPKGQLKYTEKDARDFAALVQNHPLYGEIESRVITGKDSTEADEISLALSQLKKDNNRRLLGEKDGIMVFISGHGYLDAEGNLRLKCSNFDVDAEDKTSIDFQKDLLAVLEPLNCKKLVLVDACQAKPTLDPKGRKSGGEDEYSAALDKLFRASKEVRSVLSCSPGEYSFEDPAWENGAFTYILKKTLNDPGLCVNLDKDKDKGISLGELFPYLQGEVAKVVKQNKKTIQTPSMSESWMSDDIPFFVY